MLRIICDGQIHGSPEKTHIGKGKGKRREEEGREEKRREEKGGISIWLGKELGYLDYRHQPSYHGVILVT